MAYRRVADILKTIKKFHQQLTQEIERHSHCSDDPRLDLLSDYLKHQRNAMAEAVRRDEEEYPETDVRDTWLQFVPDSEVESAIDKLQLQSGEPLGALFTRVLEVDQNIRDLYEALIDQTQASHVQEFFESLRDASISFAEQRSWGLREPTN